MVLSRRRRTGETAVWDLVYASQWIPARRAVLVLAQPGVGDDGPQDGGQVAERHKGVVDGGGEVLVPSQELVQVKHQHACEAEGGPRVNMGGLILRPQLQQSVAEKVISCPGASGPEDLAHYTEQTGSRLSIPRTAEICARPCSRPCSRQARNSSIWIDWLKPHLRSDIADAESVRFMEQRSRIVKKNLVFS